LTCLKLKVLLKSSIIFYIDLFIFKSKAPFQWIEEDIKEIMIKISAVIESLVEVEKRRKRRKDA